VEKSLVLRYNKTVKVDLVFSNECEITSIVLSGDFFAYPEDTIERLEETLRNCDSVECVENAFRGIKEAIILGVDVVDLKKKIVELLRECKKAKTT